MKEGFIREGEFLFVSPRYPQLSLQISGHGYMPNGRPERPKFVQFHPGPLGGEFRTKDKDLAQKLRERDHIDDHYREVESQEDLAAIAQLREKIVEDKGDRVVAGASLKKPKPSAGQPVPESSSHPVAEAAKGPRAGKF